MAETMNVPAGPLAGIRLLDLGTRVAAPFAATLLADLGAEVIKVELPGQGDFLRSIGPFVDGYSLFWAVENRGKKSITCDLRKAGGQVLLKRLVPLVDVVVENFQPGTLEGWGLGYEALAALNPGLVLTRVSVYGQTGPYRDPPGRRRRRLPDRRLQRPRDRLRALRAGPAGARDRTPGARAVRRPVPLRVGAARHGAHPRGLRSPRSRARARGQSALQLGAARQ